MEKCNCTGGWALKVFCVWKNGHYHHGAKITGFAANEQGDPRLPPHVCGSVNVLDVGLGVCTALAQQSTFFTIFVTAYAWADQAV
jgi:hypothetical protein